jgi:phosphatidylinositol alpha-mannosyltransferase
MPHQKLQSKDLKLTIGLVIDDSLDRPAGVQQYVLIVGEWLRSRGHEVYYLAGATTRSDLKNVYSLSRNIGVRFNGNQMRIPLISSRRQIHRLLNQVHFDVLHVQMPYSPLLAARIINAANHDTAVIGTFHIVPKYTLVTLASHVLSCLCFHSQRRFDQVVSVSPAAQDFARRAFHLDSVILPNAIEYHKFHTAEPLPEELPRKTIQILFLGKLVPRKGCLVLLQAIDRLVHQNIGWPLKVTICGDGPLAVELKRFVQNSGLENYVSFAGFISESEKPHYYASADITVFPSLGGESFGIVLIEAMASGRSAVLAGNNDGYRSVLGTCPGEVLFDPQSPDELAIKLSAIIQNETQRRQIADWQANRAKDFDIDLVGSQLLEIYDAALQQRRNVR